jgi:hypothetical protein
LMFEGDVTLGVTKEVRFFLDSDVGIRTIHLSSRGGASCKRQGCWPTSCASAA